MAAGASRSRCREIGTHVIGDVAAEGLRALPGRQMAAHAIGGIQGVVIVDVAGSAGSRRWRHVRSGQSKARAAVVESRCRPADRGMAIRAIRRSIGRARSGVHRIVGLLPGGKVATRIAAIRGLNAEGVITVDMALRASRDLASRGHLVRILQREAGAGVIELAVGPSGDGMATGTGRGGRREIGHHVIRNVAAEGLRALPGRQMATHAIGGIQGVVIVDVAGSAGCRGWRHVRSGQSKARAAVIESRRIPADRGMAIGAIRRGKGRARSGMGGIVGLLPGGEVAARVAAIRRRNLEIIVVTNVAGRAGQVGVAVRKQESRGAVIKLRAQPTVEAVASLTIARGKGRTSTGMRRIGGLLPVLQVARITSRGQAIENTACCTLVALVAVNSRVRAEERKAILVFFHLLIGGFPALHGVALRAIGPHLSAVNVGMTVGAILAHIGENRIQVTEVAFYVFVHPQ